MPVLSALDGGDVRRVIATFRDALRAHQEELNRLNVYPVPDGDTGTNMTLTIESVCTELGDADDMGEVCRALTHGSLMGARGNSGVILSQILRWLSETFAERGAVGPEEVTIGLRRASDAAYEAVMHPVEGTILTVVRRAAEAAEAGGRNGAGPLDRLLDEAAVAARDAVEQTPELLPVLKEAGVVDAGGRGFALLLDAFLTVVDGRPLPEPEVLAVPAAITAHEHGDDAGLRYEVMFLLEADDVTIPALKQAWDAIGGSIVVTGGSGLWNCHVHTGDIGAAIEAGIEAGRPSRIRITDLLEQVAELEGTPPPALGRPRRREEEEWVRAGAGATTEVEEAEPVTTAVVAVAVGEGLRRLLHSIGVHVVVAGGQSMNPSTAQILDAVERCPSDSVVILPNNSNIVPVAEQVHELTERAVAVVPTRAVVEALAALVSYDPDASLEENAAEMGAAAGRVRAGEVTRAVRDSVAECGPIAEGDWIAIAADGVVAARPTALDAVTALVDHLVDEESELVTVLLGADAVGADTGPLEEHLALAHPQVEIEIHRGGQPLYPYLVGVE